ncbi:enoyl-CoA hydratase/carnithine racemase [Leptospira ryugenii]|uniref:Enoyl-CoA hydratase/carnithine racemase n=1 Tax=Leptospira ryugenii TaxID=1917863 RepID=A0A2P2E2C7_9LEPT|nr:enoyl-CoA hydratase/isomerase family protein [Leptospira ryugenii]GBF51038.1 enoyl-CoA hydratase/carnithine racemase [Leptospira ryugenii]
MSDFLEIFHGDRILEIKMQSNEKNTFSYETFQAFESLLLKHGENQNLRVMLFTSAQSQFFSNGIEPTLMYGKSESEVRAAVTLLIRCANVYFNFPVPTIAVLNGHCMAAGAVFALYSDYRFMADKGARIGFSEAIVGLNFPSAPTMILRDLVGTTNTRDLLFFGKQLKGAEAKEIGLIDEVYPAETLFGEGMKLAEKLSKLTYNSARGMKTAQRSYYRTAMHTVTEEDIELFVRTILSRDGQEGFLSLIEKRRPNFVT